MIEPVRCVPLGFAVVLEPTVPLPLPLGPLVTVNQPVLLLTAVHAQPAGAVTPVNQGRRYRVRTLMYGNCS